MLQCLHFYRILGKRSALHIAEECLSIYGVSYLYPRDVVYTERLNDAILRIQAYGISNKMRSEMEWELQRKSKRTLLKSQGAKTFKVTESEERGLTLADTEGMFLLMGIGYLIAGSVLISEAIGGCANKCRKIARRASTATVSIARSLSHPNSIKTSQADDKDSLRSGLIFTASGNNSSNNVLRRRQSEQIGDSRNLAKVRGHRRHNSLVPNAPHQSMLNNSTSISMWSVDGINEDKSVDNALKPIRSENDIQVHKVEINRAPTPYYHIEDSFGEKIIH